MSVEPGDQLLDDLDTIMRDALDLIDLSVHNSELDPHEAYDFIRSMFGRPTADRWLAIHDERERERMQDLERARERETYDRMLRLVKRSSQMHGEHP